MPRTTYFAAVALAAVLALPAVVSAAGSTRGAAEKYVGKTSQGKRIGFTRAANGKHVQSIKAGVRKACPGKDPSNATLSIPALSVSKNGRFAYAHGLTRFSGRLKGDAASGTIRKRWPARAGRFCDTGKVRWTASKVKAGITGGGGTPSPEPQPQPQPQPTPTLGPISLAYSETAPSGAFTGTPFPTAKLYWFIVSGFDLDAARTTMTVTLAGPSGPVAPNTQTWQWAQGAPTGIALFLFPGLPAGSYTLTIALQDGRTASAPFTHTLPNRPPTFPSPFQFSTDTHYQYDNLGRLVGGTTTITINSPASDPDGDPITYSWSVVPNNSACPNAGTISGNGLTATWTNVVCFGQLATGDVTITASDGKGGTATFTIKFH